jgi:hypothetical protein
LNGRDERVAGVDRPMAERRMNAFFPGFCYSVPDGNLQMKGKKHSSPRLIVFLFLTAIVIMITARMVLTSSSVRGEMILDEQYRYFERMITLSPDRYKPTEKTDLEREIFSHLGSSFTLPGESFQYLSLMGVRTKKVKGVLVPFVYEKTLYIMAIYTLGERRGESKKDFLDAATLLSGNRESVAFVVFETKGGLKVSLMSRVSVEDLFSVVRNYFMEL